MGEIVDPRPSGGDGDRDLPIGTQVVTCANIVDRSGAVICPVGTVGTVIAPPGAELQPYRVCLPDGRIIHARRQDLAVRKEVQRQGLLVAGADATDLYQYVVYRCVVGSRAYGLEIDLVTHDVKKFFGLLLKRNGYVLEQLYSPLIVHSTPEHEELKAIAEGCITRHHSHHYFGFAETQWRLFDKERPRRVKPLLYTYRVLLTGIHLMRTGVIEANLVHLNDEYKLPYIPDLIARKLSGPEQSTIEDADVTFYRREYECLRAELQDAFERSSLPDAPSARAALHDLLARLRLNGEAR